MPTKRVGRYFERLILYWLQHIRHVDVQAHALPLRNANRTLGEIDFLFYDEQQRLTHWETAVKFYLHVPWETGLGSHLIGPNAADTWERKISKLFQQQLPRSKEFFPAVQIRQAFVKGRIFYHPEYPVSGDAHPELATSHLRGVWIRATECEYLRQTTHVAYKILAKPNWLCEQTANQDAPELLTPEALLAHLASHFTNSDQAVLISQLQTGETGLTEISRIFIVAEHWPQLS